MRTAQSERSIAGPGWLADSRGSSGRSDLKTRGDSVPSGMGRGGSEMNVVLSPALASIALWGAADGLLCLDGACLLGWIWTILALTLASAWIVQRHWPAGSERVARPVPVTACVAPPTARQPLATVVAVSYHPRRAPPTTDRAVPPARNRAPGRSSPLHPPHSRPTGTPDEPPEPSGASLGQQPPA